MAVNSKIVILSFEIDKFEFRFMLLINDDSLIGDFHHLSQSWFEDNYNLMRGHDSFWTMGRLIDYVTDSYPFIRLKPIEAVKKWTYKN